MSRDFNCAENMMAKNGKSPSPSDVAAKLYGEEFFDTLSIKLKCSLLSADYV